MGKLFFLLLFIALNSHSILANRCLADPVILVIKTTSKNAEWKPSRVVKSGQPITWKASAPGMSDQIVITTAEPVFDLSLPRTSAEVLIEASSPDGAENFVELKINSLNVTSLDLSLMTGLKILSCTDNQLKDLVLTNNVKLEEFYCHSNQLASLDVSKNIALKILICFSNQIATLELQNCPELTSLSCSRNTLTNLDLSLNPQLISLECDANSLESLNLKNGQNAILQKLNTTSNNKLFCIQVDDRAFSENNWKDIDPWTKFNTDCTFTNESPAAYNDLYETNDNTLLTVPASTGILANDTDPEADTLISVLETDVRYGLLELNEDGSFTYTPDPYFFGEDSFTYTAGDGALLSNIAEVKVNVNLVNEIPLAEDDSYTISQGETLVVNNENGVLRNDTDPDNELKEVSLVTDVSSGTLLLDSNGSFSYVPEANFYGADHFTYRVFDGYVYSAAAVATIDVTQGYQMVIPNAFTPNGDGINDTFRPVFRGFTNIRIQVFDTWGNLVFSQEGSDITGWPGLIRNAQAENGNYLYRINAGTVSGEQIEKEGLFTLIR